MEEIVCIVEDVRATTGMYTSNDTWAFSEYDLFFTDKRIILVVVHGQRDWQTAPTNDLDAIATVSKTLLSYGNVKRQRRESFRGKTPGEILRLHPDSFEIPYENIKSIRLYSGLLRKTLEIEAVLEGFEKKFKFSIPKARVEDIERIINQYFK